MIVLNDIQEAESQSRLDDLYTDLLMLADGSWEPDSDSIACSIESVETIASNLSMQLKDKRTTETT